ncbi:hypothetical protein ONS95_003114 [Cadophora gregata]|uniref:uncharacterized protein n=1 Tax=Cadophora gregata TaxID=51156 RepID=UPI0026DD7EBA|nr:uncharacterized protein ONS95_003114 [Cadophora gregata]KAK0108298.1 hypothetical protein ONS95_003114 [Cadophora gregata]KAK0109110.1 hypothetical protein ONS96_002937 [Cadophora gregata f. sp. sojae]
MDVTSLLNANSLAVEQQRKDEKDVEEKKRETPTKVPSRNRTPWDAGGYSLPINTISNPTTPPHTQEVQRRESQSTPTSPRHKFSDSRSSLSSFTSSLQSASHSRFSSLSTVGSAYPSNGLTEAFSSLPGQKPQALDLGNPSKMDGIQPVYPGQGGSISPTESLDALALVAENEIAGQQARQSAMESKGASKDDISSNLEKVELGSGRRPSSPSDAILIKRPSAMPSLRLDTGDRDLHGMERLQSHRQFLSAPLEHHHQSLVTKSHKRALSAPSFPASMTGFTMSSTSSLGPRGEPTPPSSLHPDRQSPTAIPSYAPPATPPQSHGEIPSSDQILCMYIPNCDTGSQLRKAISHIFGRNKMCTRLIPARVWVHYCRKHYQRSRYRNPKEYAKLQCDLVQTQIRRVHEWSLENASRGLPGVVQDWGLAVRKREQKRLDEMNGSKKRNITAFENSDDEDGADVNGRGSNILPATAVPDWLLERCGKGYSTQEILQIFNQLHTQILDDTMPCFPDIEILPNIVVDSDEPKSPKGYTKRTVVGGGHKRAQSLGIAAMRSDSQSHIRRMSHPDMWSLDHNSSSPVQKKRRANGGMSDTEEYSFGGYPRSRLSERPLQRGPGQMAHRPTFPGISENGVEDRYTNMRYGQAPLPAPTPQRSGGQSMAAHLEMNNVHGGRRPVHQRSQSDIGAFSYGREYSPSISSAYGSQSGHYSHASYDQGYLSRHSDINQDSRFAMPQQFSRRPEDGRHNEMPQAFSHVPTHGRHQSMSMIPSTSMYQPSTYYPQQPGTQYQSIPASLPRTRIVETQEAHDVFTSRR